MAARKTRADDQGVAERDHSEASSETRQSVTATN